MPEPTVRDAQPSDQAWINETLRKHWGSTTVVSRGSQHRADLLPTLVAEDTDGRRGMAAVRIDQEQAELVAIAAEPRGRGTGSALLAGAIDLARRSGCRRLWLITTNDNLDAIAFYQQRGLRLVAVHRGGVDEARILKPSIPLIGAHGIPIHDELDFAIDLDDRT
jgi:N-acetylglutamate synthase-like GNAT family acetyltransferase